MVEGTAVRTYMLIDMLDIVGNHENANDAQNPQDWLSRQDLEKLDPTKLSPITDEVRLWRPYLKLIYHSFRSSADRLQLTSALSAT